MKLHYKENTCDYNSTAYISTACYIRDLYSSNGKVIHNNHPAASHGIHQMCGAEVSENVMK